MGWLSWTPKDVITTDKYLSLESDTIAYIKTDVLYEKKPIEWRGKMHSVRNALVWITGHADYPITSEIVNGQPRGSYVKWATINKDVSDVSNVSDNNIMALPLGITNDCDDSPQHRIFGNIEMMWEIVSEYATGHPEHPEHLEHLAYANFNIDTYPVLRKPLMDWLKTMQWITIGDTSVSMEGRRKFLIEIRKHKFTFCPRGFGIDTHRLWETLYMGGIPIVERVGALEEFSDLPICWVNSFYEITPVFLEAEYKRIVNGVWNIDKLKIGYWKKRIRALENEAKKQKTQKTQKNQKQAQIATGMPRLPRLPRLFNMDLHISVIADFKQQFGHKFDITDWCMSNHAWVFERGKDNPEIINSNTWSDLNEDMILKFQEKYDTFLRTFDGFICGHPNSFALIFEKYNKPIILINSCRYDMPFCWSKNMIMRRNLCECLHRLQNRGLLIVVSNNKADQLYLKTATGICSTHIPSLCKYTGMNWKLERAKNATFLCYSDMNLDHPLITAKSELSKPYKWTDIQSFRGIIHFPYEISTMSMFEHFSAGIPLFFPSCDYMMNHVNIDSIKLYWKQGLPDELDMFSNKKIWLDNADYYQVFNISPNVKYFDSIPHLYELIDTFVWQDDRDILQKYIHEIASKWNELIPALIPRLGMGIAHPTHQLGTDKK